ncbi:MAG: peptidyl-prolyl cis-trans isomerase [Acidobacteriota bacterium]
MLRFFGKFQRSRNLVLLIFSLVLLVGLVIFYIPNTSLTGGRIPETGTEDRQIVVARVGSRDVTLAQLRQSMAALSSRFSQGNPLPASTLKALGVDKEALDRLIEERVALSEADRLKVTGTDRDVSDAVTRAFVDSETGKFIGIEEYKRRLRLNGQDLGEYEQTLRDAAALGKMRRLLTASEQVSDRDVDEQYKSDNTKVELSYGIIDLEKIRSKFTPGDAELQAYYDQHKEEFKATDPVRKVDYIYVPTDEVGKTLKLTEQDLRAEYDQNKQTEPRVSVIKLNVLASADEPTVKAKIDELTARVRGTANTKAEDFATVAKGNSQDPSASKGGDLGFIKKNPNRSSDWRQRAFSLKAGDIDGPFRDGPAWYIMKMTEQREVPFAEMRPTVEAGLRNRRAYAQASLLADKAYEKATEYKDLKRAAEEIAKELNVGVDVVLKSTPFFKPGDTLPKIGSSPQFEEAVTPLKKGEIGDKVGIDGGLAVPQVTDIRDGGAQLTFDEARNQVEGKLRKEKEPNLAQSRAQEIVSRAKTPAEFTALLKAEGVEAKSDTNFNTLQAPGSAFGGLQALQAARASGIQLKEGEVAKAPIKFGAGYLIFAATKRTEADLSKLSGERQAIRQRLLDERQRLLYDAQMKEARKKYEQRGDIKVYQDRIDTFMNGSQ